jgi:hypothetical protein
MGPKFGVDGSASPTFLGAVSPQRILFVISGKNGRAIRTNVPHGSADRWDANFSVVPFDLGSFTLTLFLFS